MIRRHRNIVIVFLLANFLFANIGLAVNWMYCYCKGTTEVSLFDIRNTCGKADESRGSCCKSKSGGTGIAASDCCSKFEKYRSTPKPCTKKGKKYLKADLKICLKDEGFQKEVQPCDSKSIAPIAAPFYFFHTAAASHIVISPKPPPLAIDGRKILLKIQNFRC
ncbi:MAG: hypothetical protein RLZZ161_1647 [Bacteroidota bacterium]|jgi:hypothetical protein